MHSDLERPTVVGERLRDLPSELSPPLSWEAFQSRALSQNASTRPAWRYATWAAGLAAVVAGVAMWSRVVPIQLAGVELSGARSELASIALPDGDVMQQAKAAERWLAYLPAEPAVVRVRTRGAVTDLEDRIAFVDDVMSDGVDTVNPRHILVLQRERARLVNSLAQVRYAETLAAGVP